MKGGDVEMGNLGRGQSHECYFGRGDDCGSDHELLIAKFRLKLKKVEKTTRPFRYDLNQISYIQ